MKDEKEVAWVGDAKEVVCAFPTSMRKDVGYQIGRVQSGLEPNDWEPIERIGPGTKEIRCQDKGGWYRVFYVAKFEEAIYVLHAFQKKTNETPVAEIDKAKKRYATVLEYRKGLKGTKKMKGRAK